MSEEMVPAEEAGETAAKAYGIGYSNGFDQGLLARRAARAGQIDEPGPAVIGAAYRLGREVAQHDDEIAASEQPKSETIKIYELGERIGRMRAGDDLIAHGQQEYWNGYAKAIEDAFGAMDASHADFIAGHWVAAIKAGRQTHRADRPARPLVPRQRGHRTAHVQARRFAVARRVES